MKNAQELLASERTTSLLLGLNLLVGLVVFMLFRTPHGGDQYTYLGLAEGILHGRYSFWWELPWYAPDTFRNPGYPLFLAGIRWLTQELIVVQLIQFGFYCLSVLLVVRSIKALNGGRTATNLFLLLLLPSINIAYYNTGIYAEPLCMFLICSFVFVETNWTAGWGRAIALALIAGTAFQCRSSLLLLPLAWCGGRWLLGDRGAIWKEHTLFVLLFFLTTLPYGLWNLHNHGVFKLTPLEGGGGVMHMGWWSGKIPGHTEHWYWGNTVPHELISFTKPEDVGPNIARFEMEWAAIDAEIGPVMTGRDSLMTTLAGAQGKLFPTYSTAYTLAREDALNRTTWSHIKQEPGYTLMYKTYSAFRLWITGIDPERYRSASLGGRLIELYPFVLSASTFILALLLSLIFLMRNVPVLIRQLPLWTWLVYFGIIHIPFVIQARYTIPVRLLLLAMIALLLERYLTRPGPEKMG